MNSKVKSITLVLMTIVVVICIEFFWIYNTDYLPYSNLKELGSATCYISFNVKNNGITHKVVLPNGIAYDIIVGQKNPIRGFFYPVYMHGIIASGTSITVPDSVFNGITDCVVYDSTVTVMRNYNFDSTLIDSLNRLSINIAPEERNAIIYLLLARQRNCCVDDFTGNVIVKKLQ